MTRKIEFVEYYKLFAFFKWYFLKVIWWAAKTNQDFTEPNLIFKCLKITFCFEMSSILSFFSKIFYLGILNILMLKLVVNQS